MSLFISITETLDPLFGAHRIDWNDLDIMKQEAPNLMVYAMPAVLICTILEVALSHYGDHDSYEKKETFGSVLIGVGNLAVNLAMKSLLLIAAIWIYNHLPWRLDMSWWTLIPCFVAYDFCSYWSHRISHFNRFFWATHVVHHSADHYNLTVAFRQSWVQHIKTIFFIPVALMGFHPIIFFVASQLSTLYQFWVHTEAIGKLHPLVEKWFGTPSNHRVHHGSQEKYLDKNFGATFMIWDHLFGSFQYEEEKPIYGLTTPIENKTNPFILNFHEYRDILTDIKKSDGIKELLFFIFASPGKVYRYKIARNEKKNLAFQLIKSPLVPVNQLWKRVVLLFICITMFSLMVMAQNPATVSKLPQPKCKDLLFYLQRDPDANTVVYRLNYLSDGVLDERQPIKASWIRYEEKGKEKELNMIERKFAYGIRSKKIDNDEYEIRMVAYKNTPLYLKRSGPDKQYRIFLQENGTLTPLKRVFVRVNGGTFWNPNVEYIDMISMNMSTGREIVKRIDN